MKAALKEAGLDSTHLMAQPVGWRCPDAGSFGWVEVDEFPFAVEPRQITRWEAGKWARQAYELGIRYIGGCCGFEPYHIRACAEELMVERGNRVPKGCEKHVPWAGGLEMHTKPWVRARARREYWEKMKPAGGRPYCPAMSKPDAWGVTKGDDILIQQKEATSKEQIKTVQKIQAEKNNGLLA